MVQLVLVLLELIIELLDLLPEDLLLRRRRRHLLRGCERRQRRQLGGAEGELVGVDALRLGQVVEVEVDGDVSVDLVDRDVHVLAQNLLHLDADEADALAAKVHRRLLHLGVDVVEVAGDGLGHHLENEETSCDFPSLLGT